MLIAEGRPSLHPRNRKQPVKLHRLVHRPCILDLSTPTIAWFCEAPMPFTVGLFFRFLAHVLGLRLQVHS